MYPASKEPVCKMIGSDHDLPAYLHDAAIPIARVVKVYDMAHSRGRSIDNLLEHALESHRTMLSEIVDEFCIFVNVHPDYDFSTKLHYEYDANRSILIFTMPPKFTHAVATNLLNNYILKDMIGMGVFDEIVSVGGSAVEIQPGLEKTPDGAWQPESATGNPTMAAEIGMTDSKPKLQRDAERWLANPIYQPIVLTIMIFAKTQRLVLTSWIKRDGAVMVESEMTYQSKGRKHPSQETPATYLSRAS
ncbi:hypothetical protein KEM56_006223 [Ascosphaera pollenicola]|nr:hypothetical protein KEM56_006223 [Ascosphaera pollenicola]